MIWLMLYYCYWICGKVYRRRLREGSSSDMDVFIFGAVFFVCVNQTVSNTNAIKIKEHRICHIVLAAPLDFAFTVLHIDLCIAVLID